MIDRILPEPDAKIVGYAYLVQSYKLRVPLPIILSAIGKKHTIYEVDGWKVYTPRHAPKESFYEHLVFALRYEGIDLAVLNALFTKINKSDLEQAIIRQPNSLYARRIWFLFEYLQEIELDIPDLTQGNFVHLIDIKLQYAGPSSNSKRHRIRNNLPGVKNFVHLSDVQKKSMRLSSKIYQNKLWVFSVLFIPMYYFVLQVFYYWKIHKLHMLLRKKPHHKIEWNAGGVLLVKQERFPYQKHTWSTYKMR